MTDPKKPTPVAILVMPRLEGSDPTCKGCPFGLLDRHNQDPIGETDDCSIDAESGFGSEQTPGPKCPVHGPPETRAKPF